LGGSNTKKTKKAAPQGRGARKRKNLRNYGKRNLRGREFISWKKRRKGPEGPLVST